MLTGSGFMEKLGIEPATPGLQDIGLSPTARRHDERCRGNLAPTTTNGWTFVV